MNTQCTTDQAGKRLVVWFFSGQTAYAETFEHGRLLSQGWNCEGKLPEPAPPDAMRDQPADSFLLVVDGQDLRREWEWNTFECVADNESIIKLAHARFKIAVDIHTVQDHAGFFTRWLEIRNTGNIPLSITEAACWSGLLCRNLNPPDLVSAEAEFEIGRYAYNAWSAEGRFIWEKLPLCSSLRMESRRGTSGWAPPFFIMRKRGSDQLFMGELGWSRNWAMEFICDPLDRFRSLSFKAGPAGHPPLRTLLPGESAKTPSMLMGFLKGTFDDCIQKLHKHLRQSVMPDHRIKPFPFVSFNSYGVMKTDMDEQKLLTEIDKAAEAGAEMFVIDAGWFGSVKNDYPANCGDWRPGPWLPNGLDPIVERIHARGMKFGLWVAFEMVGYKSRLMHDHPEWAIKCEGRGYFADISNEEGHPGVFMNLDFSNPEVTAWVESELERIITSYHVDMLRFDGGPVSYEGGYRLINGLNENLLWRRCENLYAIFDRLLVKHPDLIIDNCNGGGGMLDIGMLERSHIAWISDDYHTSTLQVFSLNGVTLAMPPEICTRTFGTILKKITDFEFSLRVPLFGQYCIAGLKDEWRNPATREYALIKRHLEIYKNFLRPFVSTCRVFHHTPVLVGPDRSSWCALEYASEDGRRALAGVFRLSEKAGDNYHFFPRGLDPDKQYRISLESAGRTWTASGKDVMKDGLAVTLTASSASELILFQAC